VRILSVDFSIPYLLKDDDHPIGGWAVQLSIWLRALENAGHEAALLAWKGALAHVGSGQQIKLIAAYDPAQGVRIAKYFYSYIPKVLAAARAYRPDIIIQGARGLGTAIRAFVADHLRIRYKIGWRFGLWGAHPLATRTLFVTFARNCCCLEILMLTTGSSRPGVSSRRPDQMRESLIDG